MTLPLLLLMSGQGFIICFDCCNLTSWISTTKTELLFEEMRNCKATGQLLKGILIEKKENAHIMRNVRAHKIFSTNANTQ